MNASLNKMTAKSILKLRVNKNSIYTHFNSFIKSRFFILFILIHILHGCGTSVSGSNHSVTIVGMPSNSQVNIPGLDNGTPGDQEFENITSSAIDRERKGNISSDSRIPVEIFEESSLDINPAQLGGSLKTSLLFEESSSILTDNVKKELDEFIEDTKTSQSVESKFLFAGHADKYGTSRFNSWLSKRRAQAAKRYIIENSNISSDRIKARGYGALFPKFTDASRSKLNRRVDIFEFLD